MTSMTNDEFVHLYELNLIPLRVVLAALTWVLYDYFLTLEDEVKYMWTAKRNFGTFIFFWVRYYTIALLVFDTLQIHLFALLGFTNDTLCVIIDPVTRVTGAILLWSIEIFMQLRVYALFDRSLKVAFINGIFFIVSIGFFLWIMIENALRRKALIASAIHLPLPGCPSINGGTQWALWLPPTGFEFMLFCYALYKAVADTATRVKLNGRISLAFFLLGDNLIYFMTVTCLLLFNNVMAIGNTRIPWFGFGPFHAALGIATSRMMISFRKFTLHSLEGVPHSSANSEPLQFKVPDILIEVNDVDNSTDEDEEDDSERRTPILTLRKDLESGENTTKRKHKSAVFSYPTPGPSKVRFSV